jgi:hypothetical protein
MIVKVSFISVRFLMSVFISTVALACRITVDSLAMCGLESTSLSLPINLIKCTELAANV